MFDGQEYVVADRLSVPSHVARHLQGQSVVRDNPITGEREYRLAIVEEEGEKEDLVALPSESLDRSDYDSFRKVEYVTTKSPIPRPAPRGSGRGDSAAITSSKER